MQKFWKECAETWWPVRFPSCPRRNGLGHHLDHVKSNENPVGVQCHLAKLEAGKGVEIAMGQSLRDYQARGKLTELTREEAY